MTNSVFSVVSWDDFPVERVKEVEERSFKGVDRTINWLAGQLNPLAQKMGGRLLLAKCRCEGPKNFGEYLNGMKPLMRELEEVPPEPLSHEIERRAKKLYPNFTLARKSEQKIGRKPNRTWRFLVHHEKYFEKLIQDTSDRDYRYNYFSMSTMAATYLTRNGPDGELLELPQHLFLRVAAALFGDDTKDESLETVIRYYSFMSHMFYVPASPTLFNAGLSKPHLTSCFLQTTKDSLVSIMNTSHRLMESSRASGANGISLTELRTHSLISNTGFARGVIPVMNIIDRATDYVDQGGRRPGATQVTIAVWHADVLEVLKYGKRGTEGAFGKIFTSIFINDVFMERVEKDEEWNLFCPLEFPGLVEFIGSEFRAYYMAAEQSGKSRLTMKARKLVETMAENSIEFGFPFVNNGDAINRKTNQANIGNGRIHCLNLCQEIALVSDENRMPSCNLSSTSLPSFLHKKGLKEGKYSYYPPEGYDWVAYLDTIRMQVRHLHAVIKHNLCVNEAIALANAESAPIGIGSQGFANFLAMADIPFDSIEAVIWARRLQAAAYFAALDESCKIAQEEGAYPCFPGSPFSQGRLQFDMWNEEHLMKGEAIEPPVCPKEWGSSDSWDSLKARIRKHGTAHSQLTTAMPTASCSQIADNGEYWDPFFTNLYTRKTKAGEFVQINPYLLTDLEECNAWNKTVENLLRSQDGSITGVSKLFPDSEHFKRLEFLERKYQTIFELRQKKLIDIAAARGPYIDGSQSMSLFFKEATVAKVVNSWAYAWKKGLKTIQYYCRVKPVALPVKFTLRSSSGDDSEIKIGEEVPEGSEGSGFEVVEDPEEEEIPMCRRDDPECTSCN
jgi:ribonucleoside-diphosphate reductase alpha subunit